MRANISIAVAIYCIASILYSICLCIYIAIGYNCAMHAWVKFSFLCTNYTELVIIEKG